MFKKLLGDPNEKEVKKLLKKVDQINQLEPIYKNLSDNELKGKTKEFKERLNNGDTLDDILPEVFAVVREASTRALGMRHFDVQLLGGIVLHQGRIAEMKTGEGKTLVATLPAYLNALTGKGVYVVTVNDYLAKRDSEWMGKLYNFLGLSVGLIIHGIPSGQRKLEYQCDITYGTNNEYGFDYLRDNMAIYKENMVQRDLNYAIIDEVDSILIDEARTPLIISGDAQKATDMYFMVDRLIPSLKNETHYNIDEKAHTAALTEEGVERAEKFLGIDNLSDNVEMFHYVNNALKAHTLMKRDRDYVVKDGQVIIVDQFTGRLMFGRRYSDGLHQAIEAKEGVKVERESKTLATITFQNYFRMFKKLSGMTGTAVTEEEEFQKIYGMDVVVIPTNKPMVRKDHPDVIYKNERGKFKAIVEEIAECSQTGQPVLVGTISIENSEKLSNMLRKAGVNHQVLNAKFHEKEAEIIAQAGRLAAVTIATNMAGRGTDIVLGGNPEFLAKNEMKKQGYPDEIIVMVDTMIPSDDETIIEARAKYKEIYKKIKGETDIEHQKVVDSGGLRIVGTERHESRRIDNQLRGRSGRQGDPGESRFYISLEDDLMRLFGSDNITSIMEKLGMEEDMPIEHTIISRSIETAQKRVEGRNFDIRKHVLEYDDVMNKQREVIYGQRRQVLEGENLKETVFDFIQSVIEEGVELFTASIKFPEDWDIKGLKQYFSQYFFPKELKLEATEDETPITLTEKLMDIAREKYEDRETELTPETMREVERVIMLQVVDQKWMDHIDNMDQLKQGIGLRAYGQRDPVQEYKFEGYEMFNQMIQSIKEDVVRALYHVQVRSTPQRQQVATPTGTSHSGSQSQQAKSQKTIGRNDPCSCGSGKKYKKCCGN
jgi:preprotein translocase subunit SecA